MSMRRVKRSAETWLELFQRLVRSGLVTRSFVDGKASTRDCSVAGA